MYTSAIEELKQRLAEAKVRLAKADVEERLEERPGWYWVWSKCVHEVVDLEAELKRLTAA